MIKFTLPYTGGTTAATAINMQMSPMTATRHLPSTTLILQPPPTTTTTTNGAAVHQMIFMVKIKHKIKDAHIMKRLSLLPTEYHGKKYIKNSQQNDKQCYIIKFHRQSHFWPNGPDHQHHGGGFQHGQIYSTGPNSKSYRRRKARTVFSDHQLQGLEKRFECQRYLSTPERIELAQLLNLSETQLLIHGWFV
uniref:Homeobox domain-containing protein n=1 Tax=Romanomermis culicivorax TaxID=13658 RepID=A0A915I883_ROMCU